MFFGFQPPNPSRNRLPPQPNLFSGFGSILFNSFMNPFSPPPHHHVREEEEEEAPAPIFSRVDSTKKKSPFREKKEEPQEYNVNTGMYWKAKGNQAFDKGDYETAVQHYTKAIQLNNTESVFFSNRAQCYRKMGNSEKAIADSQEAIQLDVNNYKGHLISGKILAEMGRDGNNVKRVETAIVRFTKALTLSGSKHPELQKYISQCIYKAKKILWFLKFQEIRNARIQVIKEYQNYVRADPSLSKEEAEAKIGAFMEATNEQIIFSIPSHLICPITFELMEDPVTTESGQTYERQAIEQHIKHNGKTDPFTRKPIGNLLYPSIAIRKAIADFLQKNPWAFEFTEGEETKDVTFS